MRSDPTDAELDAQLRSLPPENWEALAAASGELDAQTVFSLDYGTHFQAVGVLSDLYVMPSELGVYAAFDWTRWTWGNDFLRRCEPDAVASVSGPDCVRLLTMLTRKERFAEGTWIWSAETGMLQALLRRVLQTYHPAS